MAALYFSTGPSGGSKVHTATTGDFPYNLSTGKSYDVD